MTYILPENVWHFTRHHTTRDDLVIRPNITPHKGWSREGTKVFSLKFPV